MVAVPWLLWGNSKIIEAFYTGTFSTTVATQQLNRIGYMRPESWHWLFSARILEATYAGGTPPQVGQSIDVYFDLTVGIGQTALTIEGFEHYQFNATALNALQGFIYSSTVFGPSRVQGAVDPLLNEFTNIVAQDIQLNARCVYLLGGTHGDSAKLEIKTFWAPIAHIRPEWSLGEFPGGEDKGT